MHLAHITAVAERDAGRPVAAPQLGTPCADLPPTASPLAAIPLAGDVVESIARRLGADRLAAWWAEKTGRPCGCAERRAKLNRATRALLRLAGLDR